MQILLEALKKYLSQEGLSNFISSNDDSVPIPTVWLSLNSLSFGIIGYVFSQSFWKGFLIPIAVFLLLMAMIFVFLALFIIFKGLKLLFSNKKNLTTKFEEINLQITELLTNSSSTLGTILIVLSFIISPSILGLITNSWIAAGVSVVVFILCFIVLMILLSRHHWIRAAIDIFAQVLSSGASSFRTILATTPILLITVLMVLFSSDIWLLIESIKWVSLLAFSIVVILPIMLGVANTKNLAHLFTEHTNTLSSKEIVENIFKIPVINEIRKKELLCIEDEENLSLLLENRNTSYAQRRISEQTIKKVQGWYFLSILISSLLLEIGLFILLAILFGVISSNLVQVGWLKIPLGATWASWMPIFKMSFLISTLQVAAFSATLLQKPDDNLLFENSIKRNTDWVFAILSYESLMFPEFEIVERKFEKPWHKRLGVTALRCKFIAKQNVSDEALKKACEKFEELHPKIQLIDINITKETDEVWRDMKAEMEILDWKYIHNRKVQYKDFTTISREAFEDDEQHLLGRQYSLTGKKIPTNWFGDSPKSVEIGKAIWENDIEHELVMHPRVNGNVKTIHVHVHLFRKLSTTEAYKSLVDKYLDIIHNKVRKANLITINLYYRSGKVILADLMWTKELGEFQYSDEIKKREEKKLYLRLIRHIASKIYFRRMKK